MQGAEVVRDIHVKLKDKRLSTFAVFLPMVLGDSANSAETAAKQFVDAGIRAYWDGQRNLGKAYASVVPLPGKRPVAWDVYFVYGPDAVWGKTPPVPAYWMHQLGDDERCLDAENLRAAVEKELKAIGDNKKRLVLLTREGCSGTAVMRERLEEALEDMDGWSYETVDLATLPKDDLRRGYPTPTVLREGKDLFGLEPPKPGIDSPG